MRWVWVMVLGVAGCAAVSPGARDAEAAARLDSVERALEADDPVSARRELDSVLASRPRAGAASRARSLDRELAARELEPFEPAFRQIAECLERRDHVLARRMLEIVHARGPLGAARREADAFGAILDGRELVGMLDLELEAVPLDKAGEHRVVLVVSHALDGPVRVRCPGSVLDFFCLGVNERGIEQRVQRRVVVDALDELEIEPGRARRLPLATFYVPVGGLIGARAQWRLDAVGGTLVRGGRELPANRLEEARCEVVRLDPRLPSGPIEPAELLDYVARGGEWTAALLERAVRIEPARRDEALDLLAEHLVRRPDAEIKHALPALRWLACARDASEDEALWRARLAARLEDREAEVRPALDLPEPVSSPRGER